MNWVRIIAVVLLIAALLFSVTDLFDTWDNAPQTGNDVEYNAVFVILCVGAVLACFRLLLIPTFLDRAGESLFTLVMGLCSPDSNGAPVVSPATSSSLRI